MTIAPERPAPPGAGRARRFPIDAAWVRAHWTSLFSLAVVGACSLLVIARLEPGLVLTNTTPAGGDMGAHVWWPAYLRDHLLPWRLAGWSHDFYMGFPAGQFYFPLPALMILVLDLVLPYNIAFKLVVIAGPALVPAGAFVFLRQMRAPRPGPELAAVAITFFLFFRGINGSTELFYHQVMGGTLVSTLAGEFSFTIALALALFFLGAYAAALDRRCNLAVPAVLFAAVITSHVVVAVFAAVGAVMVLAVRLARDGRQPSGIGAAALLVGSVITALWFEYLPITILCVLIACAGLAWFLLTDRSRVVPVAAVIGVVGFLVSGIWAIPFVANIGQTTNMRYEKLDNEFALAQLTETGSDGVPVGRTISEVFLFTDHQRPIQWLALLAVVVGVVLTIRAAFRRGVGARWATLAIAAIGVAAWIGFLRWPEGHVWNLRFLPFWYVALYLLAALGVSELCRFPAAALRWWGVGTPVEEDAPARPIAPAAREDPFALAVVRYGAMTLGAFAVIAGLIGISIGERQDPNSSGNSYITSWARYNFSGYEETRPEVAAKSWPEYSSIMDSFGSLEAGPVLWEIADGESGSQTISRYGTDFALMLFPYWTDGDHPSLQGLYFEASSTTPYVFQTLARTSRNPKNTVRGIPYSSGTAGFATGVEQARLLGVRYYMVQSPEYRALADADPQLRLVEEIPDVDNAEPRGWWVYEIEDWGTVQPLAYEPVVVPVEGGTTEECFGEAGPGVRSGDLEPWLCVAGPWFDTPGALDRPLTNGGLDSWARAEPIDAVSEARRELPPVEVTDVVVEAHRVSFRVSETGVPVYVAVSSYPNWKARGADGPWRATPNGMVVVPTSNEVTLEFVRSPIDWLAMLASLLGIAGVVGLARWRWPYDPAAPEDPGDGLDLAFDAPSEPPSSEPPPSEPPPSESLSEPSPSAPAQPEGDNNEGDYPPSPVGPAG